MARFLDHWKPDIVLICGPEIVPNLVIEASRRKIPLALFNAQLSACTFSLWRRFPGFARSLLGLIDVCLVQASADVDRFASLGIQNVLLAGDLKYDLLPAPADQRALARLLARIGTRPLWVADGTYAGEEEIAFAAHRLLAGKFPGLLTVIVPPNPKRASEFAEIAAKMGLAASLSGGDRGTAPLPAVYISNDPGEAGLFYRSAGVVFSGKSLCSSGGNNPAAAARLGCAILHGPDVEDFAEIYRALDDAGGGALISDADTLAGNLAYLFSDSSALRAMGRAAAATAKAYGGASQRIMQAIAPCLAKATGTAGGEGR
jgi:3-deoxy-D-manno-octulosonic-acid transferase